jgi:hypothetical protein
MSVRLVVIVQRPIISPRDQAMPAPCDVRVLLRFANPTQVLMHILTHARPAKTELHT